MAQWLYEVGIGESRAILVEAGTILEAAIELPETVRTGAVVPARLATILIPGRRGLAALEGGTEALIEPLPNGLTEGASFHAEILREPIAEPGRPKRAKARVTDAEPRPGPDLHERIGRPAPLPPHGPDLFEAAGWSELLDTAASGEIAFPGGALRMSMTPAMTLFDVDGRLDPAALAVAGADAAARAIRRFGIGGSIGIDLPTLAGRAERQAAAAAMDDSLPQPFERTAVNGFGFLQIVRRRARASIPELLRADPAGAAARALMRRAQRTQGLGPVALHAHPAVVDRIAAEADWIATLERAAGAPLVLRGEAGLAISAGHVHRAQS